MVKRALFVVAILAFCTLGVGLKTHSSNAMPRNVCNDTDAVCWKAEAAFWRDTAVQGRYREFVYWQEARECQASVCVYTLGCESGASTQKNFLACQFSVDGF